MPSNSQLSLFAAALLLSACEAAAGHSDMVDEPRPASTSQEGSADGEVSAPASDSDTVVPDTEETDIEQIGGLQPRDRQVVGPTTFTLSDATFTIEPEGEYTVVGADDFDIVEKAGCVRIETDPGHYASLTVPNLVWTVNAKREWERLRADGELDLVDWFAGEHDKSHDYFVFTIRQRTEAVSSLPVVFATLEVDPMLDLAAPLPVSNSGTYEGGLVCQTTLEHGDLYEIAIVQIGERWLVGYAEADDEEALDILRRTVTSTRQ